MTAPVRIQRRRCAGWRMPPNTIYVGRVPRTISLFGNPFLGERSAAVTAYFAYLASPHHFHIMIADGNGLTGLAFVPDCDHAVRVLRSLHLLQGKNLACWCPLGEPCHADILLDLANPWRMAA